MAKVRARSSSFFLFRVKLERGEKREKDQKKKKREEIKTPDKKRSRKGKKFERSSNALKFLERENIIEKRRKSGLGTLEKSLKYRGDIAKS